MGDLNLIVLTADSKDGAEEALKIVRELDRNGWIELTDYALIRKDKNSHITMREMDDELSEKVVAASVGATGAIAGAAIGGPVGAAAGVATGVLAGTGSMRLMEKLVNDTAPAELLEGLDADSSVLAVIVEDHYAERLDEEFRKFGRTVQRELKRAERDAEYEAYLQRSNKKIRSIQDDIKAKLTKAQSATAAERSKIEADVAEKRAELEALQEKLQDRMKAVNADLKSEIREMNFRLELAGLRAKAGITASIDDLHRQLDHNADEVEDLIERQIESLKLQASDLRAKASKASAETKGAIESHLCDIEQRLHRQRAQLQDSFEDRLLQFKQWSEHLHVQSSLLQSNMRERIQATIDAAQHSFAEIKARVRMRNREDERAWKDIRAGFKQAVESLETAFEKAKNERV